LAKLPAHAVSTTKRVIDLMPDASKEMGVTLEVLAYGMLAQTEDAREAAQAFEEKRKPRFR
jgi:enoyl-CoA hydratase/carnithine racemase